MCEWADSLDGLVIGEVLLREIDATYLYRDYDLQSLDTCEFPEPALRLDIAVSESLVPGIEPGTEISAFVGSTMLEFWEPLLDADEDGFFWLDDTVLAPGITLGVPLYLHEPTGEWTVGSERLFQIIDDTAVFQTGRYCHPNFPVEFDGATLDEVRQSTLACDGDSVAGVERRDSAFGFWGSSPTNAVGAICYTHADDLPDGPEYPDCQLDLHCLEGEFCDIGIGRCVEGEREWPRR